MAQCPQWLMRPRKKRRQITNQQFPVGFVFITRNVLEHIHLRPGEALYLRTEGRTTFSNLTCQEIALRELKMVTKSCCEIFNRPPGTPLFCVHINGYVLEMRGVCYAILDCVSRIRERLRHL